MRAPTQDTYTLDPKMWPHAAASQSKCQTATLMNRRPTRGSIMAQHTMPTLQPRDIGIPKARLAAAAYKPVARQRGTLLLQKLMTYYTLQTTSRKSLARLKILHNAKHENKPKRVHPIAVKPRTPNRRKEGRACGLRHEKRIAAMRISLKTPKMQIPKTSPLPLLRPFQTEPLGRKYRRRPGCRRHTTAIARHTESDGRQRTAAEHENQINPSSLNSECAPRAHRPRNAYNAPLRNLRQIACDTPHAPARKNKNRLKTNPERNNCRGDRQKRNALKNLLAMPRNLDSGALHWMNNLGASTYNGPQICFRTQSKKRRAQRALRLQIRLPKGICGKQARAGESPRLMKNSNEINADAHRIWQLAATMNKNNTRHGKTTIPNTTCCLKRNGTG